MEGGGQIGLGVLHQAIVEAGVPLLWINPIEEKVGTARVTSISDAGTTRVFWVRPGGDDRSGFFGADPLEDCHLTPEGLSTPTLAALLIEEATRDRCVAYLASKRQEREAREAREQQEREQRWLQSDLRKAVLDRYGCIPSELSDDGEPDNGILAHPEHWRAAIYHDLVLKAQPGSRFTFVQCRHALRRHGVELEGTGDLVRDNVDRFLKHLHRQGVVCRHRRNKWSREIDYVQVVATIEAAEEARRQQVRRGEADRLADERRSRGEEERRVQQAAAVFAARRSGQLQPGRAPAHHPSLSDDRANVSCRKCGEPMTALLEDGYHILCAPSRLQM